jgi:carbonic anhydrase
MTATDDLLAGRTVNPPGASAAPPALHVVIVTCMDARIDPVQVFGLRPGDAHVLRNAGGVVTEDVLRSLSVSQHKLGTREVIVVQHTACGMSTVTDDGFKAELEAATGLRPTWALEGFTDVAANVRQSVARVRANPFVPHTDAVRGFVYDIESGALTEIQ